MNDALQLARAKDAKERMAGVERLHQLLEASRKSLSPSDTTSLVDVCMDLFKDSNFRVSQGALQALASAAVLSGENLKLHFNALVPAVVERLGDGKQPVRDAARTLLLTLMEVSSPTLIVERAGSYAWTHRSWRVREEFARTMTNAIGLFASTELPLQRAILPPILQMLNDPNQNVREASIACIEELYTHGGTQFRDELQRHNLPGFMVKDINARLEKIEPKNNFSEGHPIKHEMKHMINPKRSSPKSKSSSRDVSIFSGENDVLEKPVDPIQVYSEKELIREFEKIASTLVPEKDWSLRISAMQRVEGLVCGGAVDYPCFCSLLKQLVAPLSTQLSDRRSSIVKQACHLLNILSKELSRDFEACAETFIPVLFKLVVITVLVIAESADNCIKTMLRNCKVSRILPRIADSAKNDRNAVLRARCCEYAVLILEYWADAQEIQRSADLYEDLIRCCVADAMSEVRSTARMCYRMFSITWPERSRRLFMSFDPVIQRIVNEEGGGIHKRHASPSLREKKSQMSLTSQSSGHSTIPSYRTSAIVAMDRSASLLSGTSVSSGLLLSQAKSSKGSERSLENVLHASKQKVTAIESMLSGLDLSGRYNPSKSSSSLDLGVDAPSSRDPPRPLTVTASNYSGLSSSLDSVTSKAGSRIGNLVLSDVISQVQASKKLSGHALTEPSSTFPSYLVKRYNERSLESDSIEDHDTRETQRFLNSQIDKQFLDNMYKDGDYRDQHNSYVPNFQKPLLRKPVTGRTPATRRSVDDMQPSLGDLSNYVEGPASLNDALNEGLNPCSNWSARVAAFNYLRSILQLGSKGILEVVQSFEKVMKLFFQHLDDPHHKVAQAALSTLADIIPPCRKPFESYMERILPHVFSRLIDPKDIVRQSCSMTLEIVGKTYGVDSILPALIRSLDEQRSPKAKLAVIEFAVSSFNKHAANSDGSGNSGILKLWLTKLAPLVHDKNSKLKEAATTCMISVFTHYDTIGVLNFILSLSIEEQNSLRRALKQYTPRIEVDLMSYLQSKKDRRVKSSYDSSDIAGHSSEEGYSGISNKSHYFGKFSSGSVDSDSGKRWSSTSEPFFVSGSNGQADDGVHDNTYDNSETNLSHELVNAHSKDTVIDKKHIGQNMSSWSSHLESLDAFSLDTYSPRVNTNGLIDTDHLTAHDDKPSYTYPSQSKVSSVRANSSPEVGPSIPQILRLISNGGSESASKLNGLQQLIEASITDDHIIWNKYFNQILTIVLEALDDSESSIHELALSLIKEMLKNQKNLMEDLIEIVIEKLLHVTKDINLKVSNEAEHCLTVVLSQYDPLRCLSVIVPLVAAEDEKTLVTCINCLTKLVGRFTREELLAQLPSFLPGLFDAFGNQSADVRKTVVFCLVDIYIMLGKSFLPYMEGLNSTQVRLVTIYANRISQARTGTTIDSNQN